MSAKVVAAAAWLFALLHLLIPSTPLALASALVLFLFVVPAALARRRDGSFDVMTLLALAPLAIAAAAALRAGAVSFGISPGAAARVTSIAALSIGFQGIRRAKSSDAIDRPLLAGCLLGALLLALPLLSTRVLVSWHGWFHAALTEQVAAHGLPATNPGMAGEPIDYHWAFHALPALLTETASIDPLRALLGLNVAWIVVAALGAAQLARTLGLSRTLQRLAPLALFGALNTAAPLVLLGKRLVFGALPSNPWDRGEWIDWLSQRAIPRNDADVVRGFWDVRASSFAKEFLDASGMATGLVLVVVALALAVDGARAPGRRTWLLAPLTLLCAFVYPPLLPCVDTAAAALALVHLVSAKESARARRSFALAFVTACALALLFARPYLEAITSRERFVSGAKLGAFVELAPDVRLAHHVLWFTIFAALLPFLVPGAIALWRRRRDGAIWTLLLAGAANLPLVLAVRMQQGTEYKFLFAAAIALAPVALLGLEMLLSRVGPASRRFVLVASALYFAGPTAVFLTGALTSSHFKEEAIALHGRTVTPLPTRPADELLVLVRRELPPDTLLVTDLVASEKSPNNEAFAPAALAARDLYLADDRELTRRLAPFDERAKIVESLLGSSDVAAATAALRSLHRPVALLLTPYVFAADTPDAIDAAWQRTPFPAAGWHLLDHRGDALLLYLPAVP